MDFGCFFGFWAFCNNERFVIGRFVALGVLVFGRFVLVRLIVGRFIIERFEPAPHLVLLSFILSNYIVLY